MKKEVRTICFDEELRIEAYCLEGIVQPFPNHFHDHYVIGFIENGKRRLSCRHGQYTLDKGNIILFNPGDNHACAQADDCALDYRAFNISKKVMMEMTAEITGNNTLLNFSETVIYDEELVSYLHPLHQLVMNGSGEFEKEEYFLMMLTLLIERYGQTAKGKAIALSQEIERVCEYIGEHYTQCICLDQLCKCASLSKSTLLRSFTKTKGVTPYRYLQTIRINQAKKLLEQGMAPIDAALQSGFSDQSHFTNAFSMFIGLTPGAYRDIFREKGKGEEIGK